MRSHPWRSGAGFSLIEVLLVVALLGVVAGITLFAFQAAVRQFRGDASLRAITWQLDTARETAMTQRRSVEIRFTSPNQISVLRNEIPTGQTLLSTTFLEGNAGFTLFPTMPDTPDGFGNSQPVAFGNPAAMMFSSEGMLVDGTGTPINGTVFLGVPGQSETARAVTVVGATGRVRGYRWTGAAWEH